MLDLCLFAGSKEPQVEEKVRTVRRSKRQLVESGQASKSAGRYGTLKLSFFLVFLRKEEMLLN